MAMPGVGATLNVYFRGILGHTAQKMTPEGTVVVDALVTAVKLFMRVSSDCLSNSLIDKCL